MRQWLERGQAEDAVQEVFVRLLLQRRPPDNAKAWLYRAVRNEAISQWPLGPAAHRAQAGVALRRTDFDANDSGWIETQALTQALQQLPQEQREIIVLRTWGEMTLEEISEITGLPVTTVHRQYRQGLAAIRERMEIPCRNKND